MIFEQTFILILTRNLLHKRHIVFFLTLKVPESCLIDQIMLLSMTRVVSPSASPYGRIPGRTIDSRIQQSDFDG